MASVTKVELIDDMTGGVADETVTFGIDGTSYDIDLSSNNAGVLRDILDDYAQHGRKVSGTATSGRPQRAASSTGTSNREHTQRIREWARAAGKQVKGRGRIPSSVVNEYDAAQRSLTFVG